jgi:hypothetical protein
MRGNIRTPPDTRQEGDVEVSKHIDKFTFGDSFLLLLLFFVSRMKLLFHSR